MSIARIASGLGLTSSILLAVIYGLLVIPRLIVPARRSQPTEPPGPNLPTT
jgi:hypothetical protein